MRESSEERKFPENRSQPSYEPYMNPDNVMFSGITSNEGFSNLDSNLIGKSSDTSQIEIRNKLIKSHVERES